MTSAKSIVTDAKQPIPGPVRSVGMEIETVHEHPRRIEIRKRPNSSTFDPPSRQFEQRVGSKNLPETPAVLKLPRSFEQMEWPGGGN
jgi:hypothetical protein